MSAGKDLHLAWIAIIYIQLLKGFLPIFYAYLFCLEASTYSATAGYLIVKYRKGGEVLGTLANTLWLNCYV